MEVSAEGEPEKISFGNLQKDLRVVVWDFYHITHS